MCGVKKERKPEKNEMIREIGSLKKRRPSGGLSCTLSSENCIKTNIRSHLGPHVEGRSPVSWDNVCPED